MKKEEEAHDIYLRILGAIFEEGESLISRGSSSVDGWIDLYIIYFGLILVLMDVWCFAIAYKSWMNQKLKVERSERETDGIGCIIWLAGA